MSSNEYAINSSFLLQPSAEVRRIERRESSVKLSEVLPCFPVSRVWHYQQVYKYHVLALLNLNHWHIVNRSWAWLCGYDPAFGIIVWVCLPDHKEKCFTIVYYVPVYVLSCIVSVLRNTP